MDFPNSDTLDMLGNILGKFPGHTRHLGYVILFAAILLFCPQYANEVQGKIAKMTLWQGIYGIEKLTN